MPYNPSSDFVALWRSVSGGVEKAEMPGMDFVIAALTRAGLMRVVTSATAPSSGQAGTAWFRPASPSFASEGALFLWNGSEYVPATPELFHGGGGSSGGGGGGDGGGDIVGATAIVFAIGCPSDTPFTPDTSGSWGIVPLGSTPQVDTLAGWNPTTFKYTPNRAGIYEMSCRNPLAPSSAIAIVKNDNGNYISGYASDIVVAISSNNDAVNTNWTQASGIVQMNGTTDFVRLWVRSVGNLVHAAGSNPIFAAILFP